jgi:hypothetical protein
MAWTRYDRGGTWALGLMLLLVPLIAHGSERLDALEGTWRVHDRFDTERLTVGQSSPVAGQADMLGSAPVRNDTGGIGVAVDFATAAADGSYVVLLWPRFGFCEVFAVQHIGRRSLAGFVVYFNARVRVGALRSALQLQREAGLVKRRRAATARIPPDVGSKVHPRRAGRP